MKIHSNDPPRQFLIGAHHKVTIEHVANIKLESNEQVTFVGPENTEVDVVKKEWGYYLSPSINKRLNNFGLTTFLVQNSRGNIFVMSVEPGGVAKFEQYLSETNQKVIFNLSDVYCAT
jgi:hypothetical protein